MFRVGMSCREGGAWLAWVSRSVDARAVMEAGQLRLDEDASR